MCSCSQEADNRLDQGRTDGRFIEDGKNSRYSTPAKVLFSILFFIFIFYLYLVGHWLTG